MWKNVGRAILVIAVISSLGCRRQPLPATPPTPVLVYPGEFIVEPPRRYGGLVSQKKNYVEVIGGQAYFVTNTGKYLHIRSIDTEREPKPLKTEDNLCLTQFKGMRCDPNYHYQVLTEPLERELWGLSSAPGLGITGINFSTPGIKVAVIDSGVDCDHEDIQCFETYNAITDSEAQIDDHGHGTHVAGTICALGSNGIGLSGVSEGCKVGAVKFLSHTGGGSLFHAIRGVRWAIDRGYQVINNSWGGGGHSQILQDLINEAKSKGILFVAAAGNEASDNDSSPKFPANYDNAISVASIDRSGALSRFSNWGKAVDIAAPGSDILSLQAGGGYTRMSGTSMAAPHISGILALLLQSGLSPEQSLKRLFETAKGVPGDKVSNGRADGRSALEGDVCKPKKCRRCISECDDVYKCSCNKKRRCRRECREITHCGAKCVEP